MSKYDYDSLDSDQLLQDIANELAESNRIARAEMDFKIMMAIDPAQVATCDFVNKDLA